MNRVDTSTAVLSLPAQEEQGDPGYFTKGNPGTGLAATVPGQDWFNAVQEELMAIIEAAGLTPDKTDTTQVLQAITQLNNLYAADTGEANAYVAEYTPELEAHVTGMPLRFKAAHANTGASTFNPGPGAIAIKRQDGGALQAGDIPAGGMITVAYDGTYYQMLSFPVTTFYYAADNGDADVYTVAFSPALTAHVVGLPLMFKAKNANTGASTINVNSIGAVAIKRADGSALLAGDIPAGGLMVVAYDGTYYQLINRANSSGACLLAENGYQWVGKRLEQWGSYNTTISAAGDIAITFPINFPTGVFHIDITLMADADDAKNDFEVLVRKASLAVSGFTVYADKNGVGAQIPGFYWRAIGY